MTFEERLKERHPTLHKSLMYAKAEMDYKEEIPDDIKYFIKDAILLLQKISCVEQERVERLFQKAYKLYVKYDVEDYGYM